MKCSPSIDALGSELGADVSKLQSLHGLVQSSQIWSSNPLTQIGRSTFVFTLSRSLPVSLCSDHQYFVFPHRSQRHALCRPIYCMRWQIENVPSQSRLPSCHPLTAETAPADVSMGGGGWFHIQLSAAPNFSIQGLEGDRFQNPNHFSFIYAASLTVEIVSRHKPRVRLQNK